LRGSGFDGIYGHVSLSAKTLCGSDVPTQELQPLFQRMRKLANSGGRARRRRCYHGGPV
jgi:hypothetical protein